MNIIRVTKGELFFEEFNSIDLNSKWLVVPNDSLRYSLTEYPGYINIYHGYPDIVFLVDEDSNYVLDIKNDYIPNKIEIQAGIVVFKGNDNNLEFLEYYDETKPDTIFYKFLRLVKNGNIYTAYGKNDVGGDWELVSSVEFGSAGKVGLVVKGPWDSLTPAFSVDYFRMYRNQEIQIINVPYNYKVELYNEEGSLRDAKRVGSTYKGVSFNIIDVPPYSCFMKVYDENNVYQHTSEIFNMVGGDVYYYGAYLKAFVGTIELHQDADYFLGYYENSKIDFDIRILNEFDIEFKNTVLNAVQFQDDLSYQFVTFSTDGITYSTILDIGDVAPLGELIVKGRIIRDNNYSAITDINPFKFNLKITND